MRQFLPFVVLACFTHSAVAGENWPQFLGPDGNGTTDSIGLPLAWSEHENVAWKTPVHGHGWSSPVVWKNQVWLTTATEDGRQMFALCIDVDSGRVVHDVKVFDVAEPERIAKVNSYASPTPVVEEGRVYVHYGTYGTACLDTGTGEVRWTRRDLNCDHHMGPGASPILFGDYLIFTVDGCDVQYIVALNKRSGETAWKTDRTVDLSGVHYMTRKCYSTPTVYQADGRLEMIAPGSRAFFAYDPHTGRELWKLSHRGWSISPRPILAGGLLYMVNDFEHPELWAVKPGGNGHRGEDAVLWRLQRGAPATPSFLVVDDTVFAVDDDGVATCLDAKTGEVLWQERLEGNFSASPLYADGRIYLFNHDATATAIAADRRYKKLAENHLNGDMRASPAVAGNALLLRTRTHLYKIAE